MSSNIQLTQSTTSGGFLSGFVEASVELPGDGLNGECVVHYGGEHSKYEMVVELVNGKREGEAVILNDGLPYLRVMYKNGEMTGIVKRMNVYGIVELRGHLLNGMENGFFEEYDNNENVTWRGYYKNGKRDNENPTRIVHKGKSGERSEWSGEFYEVSENGQVRALCLYENGVKSRVLASYNGSTLIEYDENGKRVYEGEFKGDVENGFVREGKGREYGIGGRMVEYYGGWKNGKREGFGTEFKRMIAVYVGNWENGMKNGEGKEMDESGRVVRSGKWVNGLYIVIIPSSLTTNSMEIEELTIGNKEYNDDSVTEFKLSGLTRLKRIVIENSCFRYVRLFELDGLSELESVVIREWSLEYAKTKEELNSDTRSDGSCRLVNCPKLRSIQIGAFSFFDYHSLEMSNLPSLQSIEFGEWCFRYAPFSLTGFDWLNELIE